LQAHSNADVDDEAQRPAGLRTCCSIETFIKSPRVYWKPGARSFATDCHTRFKGPVSVELDEIRPDRLIRPNRSAPT
jgi:hypothetical protein